MTTAIIGAGGKMASVYIPIIRQLTGTPLTLVENDENKWGKPWQDNSDYQVGSLEEVSACDIGFVLSNTSGSRLEH